jgi:hypothetical protein
MVDTARVVDSLLHRRGEGAVLRAAGGDVPIQGVWQGPYNEFSIGGVAVESPDPTFAVRTLDYQASGAKDGDTLEADPAALATASPAFATNTWTIVDARPGDLGLTHHILRAYS